ncbi:MAG: BLUF domain-containing protein [Xanthomonadales bacterium]|nr:BLUF domain-containing protein [Xanthomonadales bacterium]MCB1634669.1 BLUF domain-containing protein [Xanthomonadales bacterium]MCB1641947.1 BLUF domain-containing protein [Xanthomonadales bacterium]
MSTAELVGKAYESQALRQFSADELAELLDDARNFNCHVGVSGVLFHHLGRFFQYLEGPANGVRAAYARIEGSARHHQIKVLFEDVVPERHFEGFFMGFCEPPEAEFQSIANAEWANAMPLTRNELRRDPELSLVLSYWSRWVAGQA